MLPIIQALTGDEAKRVALTWHQRAQREAELHLRFEALFQALRAHQASPTVVTLAEQTSEDCAKHAQTYLKIANEFGSKTILREPKRLGPLAPSSLTILERIVYELVALSCIEETLTGAMMGQIYQHAKHPTIRLTAHMVFQDEIWHSRLGWAHLGNLSKQQDLSWLSEYLRDFLNRVSGHELWESGDVFRQRSHMLAYGELDDSLRREILRDAVNTIILPGLESFGIDIDSGRNWSDQYLK